MSDDKKEIDELLEQIADLSDAVNLRDQKLQAAEEKLARCESEFLQIYKDTSFFERSENDFYQFVEKEFPENFKGPKIVVNEVDNA